MSDVDVSRHVDDFLAIYAERPISSNSGGMGLNHCFGLYSVLRELRPRLIVESGVWRGQSTWLIESAAPDAELHCLDPRPDLREYTSASATYHTEDFGALDWSEIDTSSSICFFDDHQSAYARLMEMRWFGFKRAIFEDNFPVGQGDAYSLRHAFAGVGHPHIQMSEAFAPRRWRERRRREAEEAILRKYVHRQHMIRIPNRADSASIRRNIREYWEVPPLALNALSNWGTSWEGPYAPLATPLYRTPEDCPRLDALLATMTEREITRELQYGYMAFVELR